MILDEAIKHAEELADYDCYNEKQLKCAEEYRQLAEWLKELKQLREQTRWIPVTEDLPEEGTFVLASYNSDEGPDVVMTYYNKYGFTRGLMTAWMPLPQPYKAESEDKE